MSEISISEKAVSEPQATYLKNYKAPNTTITHVDLTFDLHDEYTLVTAVMQVECLDDVDAIVLHGEDLTLESIKLNGNKLTNDQYEMGSDTLTIKKLADKNVVETVTRLFPQNNTALLGLYRSKNIYCTQCEAEGFRRITYFQDRPDVLATFTTTIIADKATHPVLLSNGNLIDKGDAKNGRHWVKWDDPFKKPSYLFALVAGDLDLTEDEFTTMSGRNIALRVYVDKGFSDQTQHAVYSLKEAMRWDEKTYGREYDLDIYMIVAIGDFVMGAMENKGLNIFNTKYVLAKPETATDDDYIHILSVIGHEYFHNWTGNRVTCRDWFQLSLKEGLTIFRDQNFSEDVLSQAVMRIRDVIDLREAQFSEDAGPLAHPVRPDTYIEINNFYTSTIYNKGAEVLRMLQTLLGKETFRHGMDLYFEKYDGKAVTIEDYVGAMEEVSGVDLTQFRLWYSQAGTPIVDVKTDYDATHKRFKITMIQQTKPTPGQPEKQALLIPIKMGLLDESGKELTADVLQLKSATQTFTFDNIPSRPVLSLLRNFSAPIKLNYDYTDEQLIFLVKHDTDAFNRWESLQRYLMRLILSPAISSASLDLFSYLIKHERKDLFLLSEMLLLPSENYIGEQMDEVDVDAIHSTRENLLTEIAHKLREALLETYHDLHADTASSAFNVKSIGKRQLKNRCLSYLMRLPDFIPLGMKQFTASYKSNMTDTIPALVGLANTDSTQRKAALETFYTTWKDEPLVVDKWLSIQATSRLSDTLQQVKQLLHHQAFDIKNPNKVYALIGAFAHRNPVNFHLRSGEGYVFLREMVQKLDVLNPQVAGRMVKPLTHWRRYDKERQNLMREQLNILAAGKLSPDLYELVNKSR